MQSDKRSLIPQERKDGLRIHLTICLLLTAVLSGCSREPLRSCQPNVLLISVDTLRHSNLGCYGYDRPTSPHIDKFAQEGVVFENMISVAPWTLPTHASILTGLYPSFHGIQEDGVKLSSQIKTLAEVFQAHGYRTIGVISHIYVSSVFGFDEGFDHFDDSLIEGGMTSPIAEQVVDRFLDLVDDDLSKPFFGFIHFFDPHADYMAPRPFRNRFADPNYRGLTDGSYTAALKFYSRSVHMPEADLKQLIAYYDEEIAYVDSEIGILLEVLRKHGQLDNTIIAFTADHGEEFKEHGGLGHGRTLYREQLRVPFIIKGHHDLKPGTHCKKLVSPIDIAPTLLQLAGLNGLHNCQGRSMIDAGKKNNRPVFSESIQFGVGMRSVQLGKFKAHQYLEKRNFFDLSKDPWERRPLCKDPTGGKLSIMLDKYVAEADSGWHIKLCAMPDKQMRCRATIHTTGRIVDLRRYFSKIMMTRFGKGVSRFTSFALSPDKTTLTFDIDISKMTGEISFRTEPFNVPVTFDVEVTSKTDDVKLFLGRGEAVLNGKPVMLKPDDSRLAGLPQTTVGSMLGCYIRTVITPLAMAPKVQLPDKVRKQLESLGYVGDSETP